MQDDKGFLIGISVLVVFGIIIYLAIIASLAMKETVVKSEQRVYTKYLILEIIDGHEYIFTRRERHILHHFGCPCLERKDENTSQTN